MAGVLSGHRYFSRTYVEARQRFRSGSARLGAEQEALPIGVEGPDGTPLTIDMAWHGPRDAKRIVVVSSGTHGVEGYMGSAAQLAVYDQPIELRDDVALVMIHAVNPYGFAFVRRVNEDNIDLNRNFLLEGQAYTGSPEAYRQLDAMLNPPRPPGPLSLPAFFGRTAGKIAKYGFASLKSAVAGGQYDFPMGVFFGGNGPSNTMLQLQKAVPRWFGHAEHLLWIDYHTGLGKPATFKHLVDHTSDSPRLRWLVDTFGPEVQSWDAGDGVAYAIRGGLGVWMQAMLPAAEVDVLAMEFGTVPALKVITALHLENRAHHYAAPYSLVRQQAKERLMRTFNPESTGWRDAVVDKGQHAVFVALDAV